MNTPNPSQKPVALPRTGRLTALFLLARSRAATALTFNLFKGFDETGDSLQAALVQETDINCFGLVCHPTASVRDVIYPENNLRFDRGNLELFDDRQAPDRCSA
jgi:hypothetical protein